MSATPEVNDTWVRPTATVRLDTDVVGKLQDQLLEQPTSIPLYLELIKYYQAKDQTSKQRDTWDTLCDKFPWLGALWIQRITYELDRDEFDYVETLFKKCLGDVIDLPLWRTYVNYVRRKNNIITGGEEARGTVLKAYDIVGEKLGMEPHSGAFWQEYIGFVDSWKPVSKWESEQRVDLLRQVYKKCLLVPHDALEQCWSQYTVFENEANGVTARKFISDASGDYMRARQWYKEWCAQVGPGASRGASPGDTPPGGALPLNSASGGTGPGGSPETGPGDTIPGSASAGSSAAAQAAAQAAARKYAAWLRLETQNKLALSPEKLAARVEYVYRQSVQELCFCPETWFRLVNYYATGSNAINALTYGLRANPTSLLLTFKMCEFYEQQNQTPLIAQAYDSLIESLLLQFRLAQAQARPVDSLRSDITKAYCQYMLSAQRTGGLAAARKVFGRGRKLKGIVGGDIFVESALLEHYNGDTKTALKVLELGYKSFDSDSSYVLRYMEFLALIRNDASMKLVFENSLPKVEEKERVFYRMLLYESKFGGSVEQYAKLERRFLEMFPTRDALEIFKERYGLVASVEPVARKEDRKRERDDEELEEIVKRAKLDEGEFVRDEVYNLLRALPRASYFAPTFDPVKLVALVKELKEQQH